MACLSDETLIACNEGSLGAIEAARVRDHLLLCPACRETAAHYRLLERALERPQLAMPPARLVPQVMERLFPAAARITSIAAVAAASFVFLVSWIYIYFDFSSSSLVQALRLTTDGTTGWLAGIIQGITSVYNGAQAVRKALGAMLRILFPAPLGVVAIAVAILGLSLLLALTVFRPRLKKAKRT
ncbi:MAG: hypothetical protein PHX05_00310 [Acidobacteriota bacterium]|nr:hypothetical protein [Acidobacteriota bacterium]